MRAIAVLLAILCLASAPASAAVRRPMASHQPPTDGTSNLLFSPPTAPQPDQPKWTLGTTILAGLAAGAATGVSALAVSAAYRAGNGTTLNFGYLTAAIAMPVELLLPPLAVSLVARGFHLNTSYAWMTVANTFTLAGSTIAFAAFDLDPLIPFLAMPVVVCTLVGALTSSPMPTTVERPPAPDPERDTPELPEFDDEYDEAAAQPLSRHTTLAQLRMQPPPASVVTVLALRF